MCIGLQALKELVVAQGAGLHVLQHLSAAQGVGVHGVKQLITAEGGGDEGGRVYAAVAVHLAVEVAWR